MRRNTADQGHSGLIIWQDERISYMGKKRRKLHELLKEEDIRYRGPISYQGFQALGWLCITMVVVILLVKLGGKIKPELAESTAGLLNVLNYFRSLSLPFLLIANFSKILNNSEGYKKQLIRNGGIAVAIYLGSILLFGRYVVGSVGLFVSDPENVAPMIESALQQFQVSGVISFNMFIDLFLCTLFMYFLNARPPKVFTGKKVIFFRLFALLPVAYEVCSMLLKGFAAAGKIQLPLWTYPLLTVKPPVTFLLFMMLALYIKKRERHFRRYGKTHAEYQAYLKTNRNSLQFSVFLSIILVVAAIIDFILMLVLTVTYAPDLESVASASVETVSHYAEVSIAMGFGGSVPLIFVAPLVLLYSYTRIPRNKLLSLAIPVIAFALMLLIFLEGIHQGLGLYSNSINKVSLQELLDTVNMTVVK